MRVKGGFSTRFDLDCPPNIVCAIGGDGGIPKQQALVVWILSVGLDSAKFRRLLGGFEKPTQQSRKLFQ
jgi:hypothetical protein